MSGNVNEADSHDDDVQYSQQDRGHWLAYVSSHADDAECKRRRVHAAARPMWKSATPATKVDVVLVWLKPDTTSETTRATSEAKVNESESAKAAATVIVVDDSDDGC